MKHRLNAPPRSWSFPWETQTFACWAGTMAFPNSCPARWGHYLLFAGARRFSLSQLPSLESRNLEDDSIVSLSPLGCATSTAARLPSHQSRAPRCSAARPRGAAGAPGAWGALALRAGGHTARRVAASSLPPETFKWSGLSSAQRTTLSNCFPFYSQAGS